MATPTYMRSLSPWAVNSAARTQHHYYQLQQAYSPSLSINSHNTHIYTHHLQSFNSTMVANPYTDPYHQPRIQRAKNNNPFQPGPVGGRRRSSSIRSRAPPPFIKFDPFADEPLTPKPATIPSEKCAPLSVTAQTYVAAPYPVHPDGPTEIIQRYPPRRTTPPVSRAPSPIPLSPILHSRPLPRSSPSPPPPSPVAAPRPPLLSGPGALGGPNVSKLVAGIMLNRMSVGKPMRRRVTVPAVSTLSLGGGTVENPKKREYVKSCLSSVVSIEA